MTKLARAVKATLGPRGRNAVIDKGWGSPTITKDGVTVAEEVELKDKYENIGAKLVKEAASKTTDVAGDGTTTATVLAEAIFKEGYRNLTAGADAMALARGIRKAVEAVVENLKKQVQADRRGKDDIANVASISANNDREIGKIMADAFEKVGKDGVITVEEGKGLETDVDVVEGMQFDRGFLSPNFITNPDEMIVRAREAADPRLRRQDQRRHQAHPAAGKDPEGQEAAADHRRRRRRRSAGDAGRQQAPRHPQCLRGEGAGLRRSSQGDARRHRDPHRRRSDHEGPRHRADKVEIDQLGQAKKVAIDNDNTTIIEGAGEAKAIQGRIEQIRREIDDHDHRLRSRKAPGAAGEARRRRGADQRRRRDRSRAEGKEGRIEDALHATRAAVEEGVVGGGVR